MYNLLKQPVKGKLFLLFAFIQHLFFTQIYAQTGYFKCPEHAPLAIGSPIPDYIPLVEASSPTGSELTITQTPQAGTIFVKDMRITITVTDDNGWSPSCMWGILVLDNINPVIICPANQALVCGVIPDYTSLATASDNIDTSPTITQSPSAGAAFSSGMIITLTANDDAGNSAACTFAVNTATDNVNPSITCPGTQTLSCGAVIPDYTPMATTTDNCDANLTVTQSPSAGAAFSSGMIITLTANDDAGNSAACTFAVNTATDNVNPSITCPGNQTLSCGTVILDYTSLATATDNCDANLTITQSPSAGAAFSPGMIITLTANDDAGNSATCTFTINTATDNVNPSITCPGTQTLSCGTVIPDYTLLATTIDNCDANLTITQSPSAGAAFIPGMIITLTANLTANDDAENSATCTFTVNTATDNVNPSITCPGNQTLACSAVIPDYTLLATATDNCDANLTITQSPAPGTQINKNSIITISAIDLTGNKSFCTFQIDISEDSGIDAGDDQTIYLGGSAQLNAVTSQQGTYQWQPVIGLNNPSLPNPVATPASTTTYQVEFTSKDGCKSTDGITIILDGQEETNINALSPNNDGINDVWIIKNLENNPDNIVSVFNRWGNMVYKTKGYNNTSNVFAGQSNQLTSIGAGKLPEGTYFFSIQNSEDSKPIKGYLIIKR